jgi:hypothetical protein
LVCYSDYAPSRNCNSGFRKIESKNRALTGLSVNMEVLLALLYVKHSYRL